MRLLFTVILILFCVGCSMKNDSSNVADTKITSAKTASEISPTPSSTPVPTLNPVLEEQYNKAYTLFHSGKYSSAITACDNILKSDPNHFKALNIKGIALCFSDNFETGMKNIDTALTLAPDDWYVRFNKALALSYHKDFENALIWYNKSLELKDYAWSHYGKAAVYGQKGDVANTVSNLKLAIEKDSAVKDVAKNEKDFNPVRNSAEFKELFNTFSFDKLPPATLPILYYHAVSDSIKGLDELFVSPQNFKSQMNYLKQNNYDVITFEQLPMLNKYKKPIIITFDDGYENNYTEAFPILKEFNFKAVIFMTSNFIDKEKFLKTPQIKEMSSLIKFEAHTVSHPELTKVNAQQLEDELITPKRILKDITGQDVIAFAYPTGDYNESVIKSVKKNYSFAVSNKSGLYNTQNGNFEILRVYIPRACQLDEFMTRLKRGTK